MRSFICEVQSYHRRAASTNRLGVIIYTVVATFETFGVKNAVLIRASARVLGL